MATVAVLARASMTRARSRPLRRVLVTGAGLFLLVLGACRDQAPTAPPGELVVTPNAVAPAPTRARYVPGHLLVRFRPAVAGLDIAAAGGASLRRELARDLWLATVGRGRELSASEALNRNPDVLYAEPDYLRTVDGGADAAPPVELESRGAPGRMPNRSGASRIMPGRSAAHGSMAALEDPLCPACARPADQFFEYQWNMHNDGDVDFGYGLVMPTAAVDADIDWLEAFDHLGPNPAGTVRIGILDTGVRSTHVDVCGKVLLQKNLYDGSGDASDDYGHGTHVAGIAGGCADNPGGGVAGVAYGPDMRFVVGKVCAQDGTCAVSAIVEGLHWIADNGANVVNMSFGEATQSQAEADALQYATDRGVLAFCAAGNEGTASVFFPAADPNCVAVTATDYGDALSSYSSFGAHAELAAPGGDSEDALLATSLVWSSWAGWDTDYLPTMGTSMAAPHATGLGALLYALGLTDPADIRACLRSTADDLGTPGWDERFGWGRINMYSAVTRVDACLGSGGGGDGGGDPGGTLHVGDLEGSSRAAKGNHWEASMSVLVLDDGGAPVQDAEVAVSWTGAATGAASGPTDGNGTATFGTGSIRGGSSVTFTVDGISHASLAYDPAGNTDLDDDSDGTTLEVVAPGEDGGSDPPPAGITLTAVGSKEKGERIVDLTWSGARGETVRIWENDRILDTTPNDEAFSYSLGKGGGGTFVYLVCETVEPFACSNPAEVVF